MALTAYGKNMALTGYAKGTAPAKFAKYVTLAEAIVSSGSEASSGAKLKIPNANTTCGLKTGKWVMFESVTGGKGTTIANSIVVGRPYIVVGEAAGFFEVASEEGGAAIVPEEGLTAFVVASLTESAKARVETAYGTPSLGEVTEPAKVLEVEAGKKARYAMYWNTLASSGASDCMSIAKLVVEETFNATGKYELTADKVEASSPTVA